LLVAEPNGADPARARSIRLLANSTRLLADRCVDRIEADVERCREYAESSPAIVTR
jgi:fumarate hydratase class II